MTTMFWLPLVLPLLIALMAFKVATYLREQRELEALRKDVHLAARLLHVWAAHWGEDPPHVRMYLDQVLKDEGIRR